MVFVTMMTALHSLICWMTCSHTGYSITMVWVIDLVPSPLGKLHMLLDTLGHGICFLLLNSWVSGVFFAWHAVKYFWSAFKVTQ